MVMHFKAGVGTNELRTLESIGGHIVDQVELINGVRAFFIEEMPEAAADIMLRFVMILEITAILVWRQKWR
jgi:hypothetical protein